MGDYQQERAFAKNRIRRRGMYLVPSLFTTAALFAGFWAIVQAMNGRFDWAAEAIFVAMVLDSLDGRVARLTKTQSAFGAEYDSLSDMVCFGRRAGAGGLRVGAAQHGQLRLARGVPLLRLRGVAPGALQHQSRGRRQALLPGLAEPRGGGARRRLRVDHGRQRVRSG